MSGKITPEIRVQAIGGIQTQAVNVVLLNPRRDRREKMLPDHRIAQVELDQIVVAGPTFVVERVTKRAASRKIEVIPILIRRCHSQAIAVNGQS